VKVQPLSLARPLLIALSTAGNPAIPFLLEAKRATMKSIWTKNQFFLICIISCFSPVFLTGHPVEAMTERRSVKPSVQSAQHAPPKRNQSKLLMEQSTNQPSLLQELQQASEGLLFMSENDYPLTAFVWEQAANGFNTDMLLAKAGHPAGTLVETRTVDNFFRNAIRDDLYGEEAAARFRQVVELLKTRLTDLQVYRLGEISIDVYVVGKTATGDLAGYSTRVIET
jgi:hypothetical protein